MKKGLKRVVLDALFRARRGQLSTDALMKKGLKHGQLAASAVCVLACLSTDALMKKGLKQFWHKLEPVREHVPIFQLMP